MRLAVAVLDRPAVRELGVVLAARLARQQPAQPGPAHRAARLGRRPVGVLGLALALRLPGEQVAEVDVHEHVAGRDRLAVGVLGLVRAAGLLGEQAPERAPRGGVAAVDRLAERVLGGVLETGAPAEQHADMQCGRAACSALSQAMTCRNRAMARSSSPRSASPAATPRQASMSPDSIASRRESSSSSSYGSGSIVLVSMCTPPRAPPQGSSRAGCVRQTARMPRRRSLALTLYASLALTTTAVVLGLWAFERVPRLGSRDRRRALLDPRRARGEGRRRGRDRHEDADAASGGSRFGARATRTSSGA